MGTEADASEVRTNFFRALWQPAGVVYLGFCLAGLAAGLWHYRIVPHFGSAGDTTVPTLQTLAVAQVFFFLLVYPIVLLRRQQAAGSRQREEGRDCGLRIADCGLKETNSGTRTSHFELRTSSAALCTPHFALILELAGMFLITVPFYFIAAWFGDATAKDVLRAILASAAVCPLGILAGRLLAKPAWRGGVMLALLVIVLGLPGAWYICVDFLNVSSGWVQHLSPVLFAWQSAAARETAWLPQPLWAWLLWPILAAAGGAGLWAMPSRKAESNPS